MIYWVLGIGICVFILAVMAGVTFLVGLLMRWLWVNIRAGVNPFPGVTPWRAFWIWRFTEPGSRGDVFDHPHHHEHH